MPLSKSAFLFFAMSVNLFNLREALAELIKRFIEKGCERLAHVDLETVFGYILYTNADGFDIDNSHTRNILAAFDEAIRQTTFAPDHGVFPFYDLFVAWLDTLIFDVGVYRIVFDGDSLRRQATTKEANVVVQINNLQSAFKSSHQHLRPQFSELANKVQQLINRLGDLRVKMNEMRMD